MTACLSPNGQNVYQDGGPPTRLMVATATGVSVLERDSAGAVWHEVGRGLEGQHVSSLLFEEKHRGLFAGAHSGGLFFSGDDGRSWERRTNGLTEEQVFSVRYVDEPSGVALFAGTEPAALYKSHDYGQTWHELAALRDVPGRELWDFPPPPHIAHVKTMAFDPRDPQTFFLGVEQGALLKTVDGGRSWRELEDYSRLDDAVRRDIHQVVYRPGHPDEVFMSTGAGVYRSLDSGETWERLGGPDETIGYPDQLLFSPLDDRTLFLAGSLTPPNIWRQTHVAYASVLRSRDLGQTWESVSRGLPEQMQANIEAMTLVRYRGGFTLFAGTTNGDVFSSDDGAETWSTIATGLGPVSKGGHYRNLLATAR